ncbi:hypothetical protein ACU686_28770 [Yinghuangia aomiensis]
MAVGLLRLAVAVCLALVRSVVRLLLVGRLLVGLVLVRLLRIALLLVGRLLVQGLLVPAGLRRVVTLGGVLRRRRVLAAGVDGVLAAVLPRRLLLGVAGAVRGVLARGVVAVGGLAVGGRRVLLLVLLLVLLWLLAFVRRVSAAGRRVPESVH